MAIAKNSLPFEKLFDQLEDLDTLLEDGPGDESGDSEAFLTEIQSGLELAYAHSKTLTAADVDMEFTEDEENDESEDEN